MRFSTTLLIIGVALTVSLSHAKSRSADTDVRWSGRAAAKTSNCDKANRDALDQVNFVTPNESGKQFHIILEVTDNGTPPLTHYQRVIVTEKP